MQEATGDSIDPAYVDQGDTGERAAKAAADHGTALEVVKRPEAQRGFALLPRRWVVERAFTWMARFRRLAAITNDGPSPSPDCTSSPSASSSDARRRLRSSP